MAMFLFPSSVSEFIAQNFDEAHLVNFLHKAPGRLRTSHGRIKESYGTRIKGFGKTILAINGNWDNLHFGRTADTLDNRVDFGIPTAFDGDQFRGIFRQPKTI